MLMSQEEYNVHFQKTRTLHIRLELLNQFDNAIERIDGLSTNGNINLSGNSTYRRTGNLTLVIKNKTLLPSPESKIWFNRKVRVFIGLSDYSSVIHWFKMGIFLIKSVEINHSKQQKTLSLDLTDLMSNLDGTFSGTLDYQTELLAKGLTISEAIRSVITSLGKVSIDSIRVNGSDALLPYDLDKDPSSTIYDLVKELMDLYMGYEFFVNEDNYFLVQKIKDTKDDAVAWDFTQNKMDLIIDNTTKMDFSNVRNKVYIWGKKLEDGTQPNWIYHNRYARNNIVNMNAVTDKVKGDICYVSNEHKSYFWNGSAWSLLNFNVIPEFNSESIGVRSHVYSNDSLYNNDQAMLRAEYELEQKSNLAETVSFNCAPIYFLTPNTKIKLLDEETGIDGDYRIDDITVPLDISSTMSVNATKLYY